jgi:hypothetical protein
LSTGWLLIATVGAATIIPCSAAAQAGCPRPRILPAYAHNDYLNSRPLSQALSLGYRGVEADLVLRQGELRVAHDASEARRGRTLESMYLRPLRMILAQCGYIIDRSTPLLLNLELKERSRAAYDSLSTLMSRYKDLLEPNPVTHLAAVEIFLVGWSPRSNLSESWDGMMSLQYKVTTLRQAPARELTPEVRLISLDYGKTIRWSGEGPVPQLAASWLKLVQAAKGEGGERVARAYNVPVHPAVYRLLLEGGIDLIGTKHLERTQRLLLQINAVQTTNAPGP